MKRPEDNITIRYHKAISGDITTFCGPSEVPPLTTVALCCHAFRGLLRVEGISKWHVAFGMTKTMARCITAHYHKVINHKYRPAVSTSSTAPIHNASTYYFLLTSLQQQLCKWTVSFTNLRVLDYKFGYTYQPTVHSQCTRDTLHTRRRSRCIYIQHEVKLCTTFALRPPPPPTLLHTGIRIWTSRPTVQCLSYQAAMQHSALILRGGEVLQLNITMQWSTASTSDPQRTAHMQKVFWCNLLAFRNGVYIHNRTTAQWVVEIAFSLCEATKVYNAHLQPCSKRYSGVDNRREVIFSKETPGQPQTTLVPNPVIPPTQDTPASLYCCTTQHPAQLRYKSGGTTPCTAQLFVKTQTVRLLNFYWLERC